MRHLTARPDWQAGARLVGAEALAEALAEAEAAAEGDLQAAGPPKLPAAAGG